MATKKQRHAIWPWQGGECASEGCRDPIDHVHHEIPWSLGGPTELGVMTGRCAVCHTHVQSREGTIRAVA
ncbi:HNH endonuclease [Aeromicrobium phoceense]|uniref:HNH endonuclease n=1 Tax=Aeromicrobium phoceense TaxID=2754045 RepID=UPI003B8355B7